jgi:diazepam-binding inhibitor (GABA receptor modulator, acyl-CoA-binding protein)
MDLKAKFEDAGARSKNLPERPSNEVMLQLYSLYKQGTEGDVNTERPSGFDFVGAAKYDAWEKLKGISKEDARNKYIALVNELSK